MITKTKSLEERCLEIYERDLINNENILIATVYCIKKDNEMWACPSPQIFNEVVYNNNKEIYEETIQSFRNDCIVSNNDNSLIASEIEQLKEDNATLMKTVSELCKAVKGME